MSVQYQERVWSMWKGCTILEEGVKYMESVCSTMSITSAVRGEGAQYEEIEGVQWEEMVCSTRRVTPSSCTGHSLYRVSLEMAFYVALLSSLIMIKGKEFFQIMRHAMSIRKVNIKTKKEYYHKDFHCPVHL